jgi:radical SAM family uncharacterized protein
MADLNELLLTVQKPARYIGGEWNSVKKEWTPDRVKVCLAFPEVYEVGMSYLGLKILYGILNRRADCLAERVFSPWPDFEDVLRKNGMPLYGLESRRALKEFDIIGLSLAYELNYTNALNLLDLGGVPVRSVDRSISDPLVIAGGPACFNPEPMAEFIDAFIIGDGEEAIERIIDVCKAMSKRTTNDERRTTNSRVSILREFAKIHGVYVPSLYEVKYNGDGTIESFTPEREDVPAIIKKAVVKDLDSAYFPTDIVVPYIQVVHDRIMLEIMRGCPHACKFCQAGATYRPRRERSKDKVLSLAAESHARTGYEEVSLLSLSSGDHSRIVDIIKGLNETFKDKAVAVSVPSLRIDHAPVKLPALISQVKKTNLTFAPEAGSECLRKAINKNIDIDKLIVALKESFRHGWRNVKLYFMIGLPSEKDEDLVALTDLLYKVSNSRREIDKADARVTASINAFVPKPHTPFQNHAMERVNSLERKRDMLRKLVKSRFIELDFHPFRMAYLEAVFARGDRKLSAALYAAWKRGLKFDGWNDRFKFDEWTAVFRDTGLDPDFYAARERMVYEKLPWDFIEP